MGEHRHLVDAAAWISAGVAAVSLANAAVVLTIIATCLSIMLACIRIYDRVKYGPVK